MFKKINVITKFLIICPIIITGLLIYIFFIPPKFFLQETITYEVQAGSSVSQVIIELKDMGIIKSKRAFKAVCVFKKCEVYNETYKLSSNMNLIEVINIVTNFENSSNLNVIYIAEGMRIPQVAEQLEEQTGIDAKEFLSLWEDENFLNQVINDYYFITNEILNDDILYPLEGYLFPETYSTNILTAESITIQMLDETEKIFNQFKKEIENSEYNYHEILTLASIIQMEANNFNDMKNVASVFYNRINEGMKLESCATVNYVLNKYDYHLTQEQIDTESPYNTYNNHGIPPSPVSTISKDAIEATINPSNTNYLFFLADSEGNTYFSETYEEHLENKTIYID